MSYYTSITGLSKGFTSEKSVKTHHPSRVPDFAHGVLVRVTISGKMTHDGISLSMYTIIPYIAEITTDRYRLFTIECSCHESSYIISFSAFKLPVVTVFIWYLFS